MNAPTLRRSALWVSGGLVIGGLPLILASVVPWREVVTAHGGLDSMVQAAYLNHASNHFPWSREFWRLPIFWPSDWTTVMMDPTLGPALLLRALWWGSGRHPALDANLLFVATTAASFWACAWLGRAQGLSGRFSALAGCVYVLGPFAVGHWQHLNQLPSPWIPLALVAAHRLAEERRSSGVWATLLASSLVLQLLSSIYLFASALLASGIALAIAFPQRSRSRVHLGLAVVAVVLATWAWSIPFSAATHDVEGYRRVAEDTGPFQARFFDLGNAAQSHLLTWPGHVPTRPALYPGVLWALAAGLGLLVLWRRSRRLAAQLGICGAVGLVLAMGRSHPVPGGGEWPMPFAVLQDLVPPLQALRDPSRFFILTHLSLALLGAQAWQRAVRGSLGASLLLALALVDLAPGRAEKVEVALSADDHAVLQWIAEQGTPAVWSFASLPCDEPRETLLDARATLWAAVSGLPTVGGSAGFVPPRVARLRTELCGERPDVVAEGLRRVGARWMISEAELRFERTRRSREMFRNATWVVYSLTEESSP